MFWSMKMSRASRKPRPMALRMLRADRRSKGARLKMGRSWTLKTGTGRQTQDFKIRDSRAAADADRKEPPDRKQLWSQESDLRAPTLKLPLFPPGKLNINVSFFFCTSG